jgi:hypothetical protein
LLQGFIHVVGTHSFYYKSAALLECHWAHEVPIHSEVQSVTLLLLISHRWKTLGWSVKPIWVNLQDCTFVIFFQRLSQQKYFRTLNQWKDMRKTDIKDPWCLLQIYKPVVLWARNVIWHETLQDHKFVVIMCSACVHKNKLYNLHKCYLK